MSNAFSVRYGRHWHPLANGVDLDEFPEKDWAQRPPTSQQFPFLIRYMGALADDMTYASVHDIAAAVSSLQASCALRFEIFTMEWCRAKATEELGAFQGVSVHPLVEASHYKQTLAEADALVVAYNFDPLSISYIGLSLANKMPECLATGAPLLAYGPAEVATIRYLKEAGCAQIVERRDHRLLVSAIRALVEDRSLCAQLGALGRAHVAERLSIGLVQDEFRRHLAEVASANRDTPKVLIGPFTREQHAHYDETDCVAELFRQRLDGRTMIDVGAHHGSALAPFLDREWRIFAFEPDNQNRSKLLERLAKHENRHLVSLDTRCVSNTSRSGAAFFTSEQSTGISGLSAFHESHVEAQKVDITTLTDYFLDKALPPVDFLKIDTEGHDLFVLQGFPWERGSPAVIECEFEDSKTIPLGYSFHDLAGFLIDRGYTVYVSEWHPIVRYGIRHDWNRLVRYPCELADAKGWGNLLAFIKPIDQQALTAAVTKVLTVGSNGHASAKAAGTPTAAPVKPATKRASVQTSGARPDGIHGFRVAPGPNYASMGRDQWRYTHSDAKQKLWIAAIEPPGPTVGRTFVTRLRVMADKPLTVEVSFGRQGATEYEGTGQRVSLMPGQARSVVLRHRFEREHTNLKLQVEVLDSPSDGSAMLTIDGLGLGEAYASIQSRLRDTRFDLRNANRLFREGDHSAALGMYLRFNQMNPLAIFRENAVMAAKRMTMSWVESHADLDWLNE